MKTKHTKNKYPLVRVVWRDSNIYRLQDSIEYALDTYAIETISTVGFLIGYQDKNPILARDLLNKDIDQRCSVVIPVENIVSLVKIKATKAMPAGRQGKTDFDSEQIWKSKAEMKPLRGST